MVTQLSSVIRFSFLLVPLHIYHFVKNPPGQCCQEQDLAYLLTASFPTWILGREDDVLEYKSCTIWVRCPRAVDGMASDASAAKCRF